MNKNFIKEELKHIKIYGVEYSEMLVALQELINEENKKKSNNQFTIDLEGDFLFKGSFKDCENFILQKKLKNKKNIKEYGLTTPTDDNLVLYYSDEFKHLFKK